MSSRIADQTALRAWYGQAGVEAGQRRNRIEDEVVSLFDQFREPLLRYLSGFGLPLPEAEEVIQEVFLSLFQHLNRGKSKENLRGWLFRVAHNQALKWRYRTRRELEAWTEAGFRDAAADRGSSPETQAAETQTQRLLIAVVKALPERDRQCLYLRAEGLRYREIAKILDISLGAVSALLARTLARIACAAER